MTNNLYSQIEHAIISWSNDGTKTAGTLTREIINIINNASNNTSKDNTGTICDTYC